MGVSWVHCAVNLWCLYRNVQGRVRSGGLPHLQCDNYVQGNKTEGLLMENIKL